MNFTFKNTIWLLIILSFLALPLFTFAATNSFVCNEGTSLSDCQKQKLNEIGIFSKQGNVDTKVTSATLSQKIGTIVSYVLTFLGVIFLVLTKVNS